MMDSQKSGIRSSSNISPEIKKKPASFNYKKYIPLYIMFAPVFIYYFLFQYLPMGGVIIAFKNYNFMQGIWESEWAGFDNFIRFMANGDFWKIFKNTVLISAYRILFGFPAPILFAILIFELQFKNIKRWVQTISYLPHFISWSVVFGLLFNFFSSAGVVNIIIQRFGGDVVPFLSKPEYFRAFFVGSAIWKELGWGSIVYLAALTNVNPDIYEASLVDGAGRFRRLWHITLPSIRNIVSIMFVLGLGNVLTIGFEQVLVMYNAAVASVGEVIDYYIYRVGLTQANNYSYATAVGLFRSVLALLLVLVANWGSKKIDEEGAIW